MENLNYDFRNGAKSVIGTTAVQLTTVVLGETVFLKRGVLIKAASTNTGVVYIGHTNVTANSADLTDGMPVAAGESVTIEIDEPSKLYVIASAAGQKVYWVAA